MTMRIVKVSGRDFWVCVRHGVWGSNASRFRKWQKGDHLIFLVEGHVAGMAEVAGEEYCDDDAIWAKEYVFRIPIDFRSIILPENRPRISQHIKESFYSNKNRMTNYGSYLGTQSIIPDAAARILYKTVMAAKNDVELLKAEVDQYLDETQS